MFYCAVLSVLSPPPRKQHRIEECLRQIHTVAEAYTIDACESAVTTTVSGDIPIRLFPSHLSPSMNSLFCFSLNSPFPRRRNVAAQVAEEFKTVAYAIPPVEERRRRRIRLFPLLLVDNAHTQTCTHTHTLHCTHACIHKHKIHGHLFAK